MDVRRDRSRSFSDWRKWGAGCSALLMGICLLLWWRGLTLPVTGELSRIALHKSVLLVSSDSPAGADRTPPVHWMVYTAPAPSRYAGQGLYMLPSGSESNLVLFESSQPMSRARWIEKVASPGAYIHLEDLLYFVPLNREDPTIEPTVYTFQVEYLLRFRYQMALCALLILSVFGLGVSMRPVRRASPPSEEGGGWRARWLGSIFAVLPLASLGPLFSFLGRNAFYYSYGEILKSLCVWGAILAALTLILFVLRHVFLRMGDLMFKRSEESRELGGDLFRDVSLACVAGILFALFCGFLAGDSQLPWLIRKSGSLFHTSLVLAFFLFVALRWSLRGLNVLLLSFLCVTGATFLANLVGGEVNRRQVAFPLKDDAAIEFQTKPNIYLFFLESYTGREVLRDFYSLDATPFYRDLEKRGFLIRDTYANQVFTAASAATVLAMHHIDFSKLGEGVLDVKREVRDMITGRDYNPTLSVLKQNGYRISFLHRDHYLCPRPSPGIDLTNLSFRDIRFLHWPILDATGFFNAACVAISRNEPVYFQEVKDLIERSLDRPTFHFIYTGLAHTAYNFNDPLHHAAWKESYRQVYEEFNPMLRDLLDFLEEKDPNALVILIGDHGAKLFGNAVTSHDYQVFIESGQGDAETLARDQASVLFAIKTPVKSDIWETRRISHVNLFRYVFAMLSGDKTLLEHPEPDVSFSWDGHYVITRDGQPLREWEPVNPELFRPSPGTPGTKWN